MSPEHKIDPAWQVPTKDRLHTTLKECRRLGLFQQAYERHKEFRYRSYLKDNHL